ncbi:hypothetical protein PG993_004796 [Apiospora rasikravindrae]|uniref:Rhodopsin domain-containing protein n=1 Tax=Apiospora rasikravindrae TaxID=990691 RepID=A0ABR1TDU9_9PEZI
MFIGYSSSLLLAARQAVPPGPPPMVSLTANPLAAIVAMTAITSVIVLIKVYIRFRTFKRIDLDDWASLIGASFVIAITGVIGSVFQEAGLDSSSARASPGQIADSKFADRLFVFLLLAGVPNGFAKLSILFFLRNIFPRRARPWTAWCIWTGITVVVLFYVIQVLYIGIHCGPQACTVNEQVDIAKATASINLALDIFILVLAVVNVWTLKMSRRHKIGVIAVFMTGILAVACSITVLYYRVVTTQDPDAVWVQVLIPLVLVIYEPSIALITASLPAAPAAWARFRQSRAFTSVRSLLSTLSHHRRSPNSTGYELEQSSSRKRLDSHDYVAATMPARRSPREDTETGTYACRVQGDERTGS